ncbi:MAG: TetR/AcrR family transcriptional regulator [Salinisphaera sp.]|nr:TetR/AcrR family transcriptional regulator [Salinisphaera sp.]
MSKGQHSPASPWKPFAARRREREIKRSAVLQVAVNLFLEQGYDRTSLNEVAERLHITKPALYNYFDSKQAILLECYRLGQESIMAGIEKIMAQPGDGLTRLRALIRHYCMMMTQDFGQCLIRIDDRVLSDAARNRVRAEKRRIDRRFREFLETGIRDGSIKPCSVRFTAFSIAGSINWTGYWYRPNGEMSAQEIADAYASLLTDGLAADRS